MQDAGNSGLIDDACQKCGKESKYGCHGVKEGVVYSEYFCGPCYNGKEVEDGEIREADSGEEERSGLLGPGVAPESPAPREETDRGGDVLVLADGVGPVQPEPLEARSLDVV